MMHRDIAQWGPVLVGLLAATSIVVGAHVALRSRAEAAMSHKLTRIFAFGTGAFFAAVCLDFLPDAWAGNTRTTPYWIFLGALVMWIATHVSDGLFDKEQGSGTMSPDDASLSTDESTFTEHDLLKFTPLSAVVLAGALSFHTFFEGAAVSFSFHELSWSTFGFAIAIILHKLPEGILWGFALAAVFPRDAKKIRIVLIIPAVCTIVGVLLGIFLAQQASSRALAVAVGLVAGAMLYIAFAELLPSLRETSEPRVTRTWFIVGLVTMFVLSILSNVFGG